MADRSVISKLNNANYLPKRIHALPEETQELALGTLVGSASGTFKGTTPDGEEFEGLKGAFEYTDYDDKRDVLTSGKLFLPSGVDELVKDALEHSDGGSVKFAFEVAVYRAKNPQGYSWKFTPLINAEVNDPLSELRGLADKRKQGQIAPPAAPIEAKPIERATAEVGDMPTEGQPKKGK